MGFLFLVFCNIFLYLNGTLDSWELTIGFGTGLLLSAVAVAVIGSINVLGSGLTGEAVKIIFGVATILNLMFSLSIAGITIGLGLASNVITMFPLNDFIGIIGFFITTVISILILVSGIMNIIGSG